jgi:hypothetical protein
MLHSIIHHLPIGWAGRFALLRLASQWRSLLTVTIGSILVATIGASIPLYTGAIAQVGMIQNFEQQPPSEIHIATRIAVKGADADAEGQNLDAQWTAYTEQLQAESDAVFGGKLRGWVAQLSSFAEMQPTLVMQNGEDIPARLRVAHYPDELIQIVEGTAPHELSNDPDTDIEAALNITVASQLGLNVGDVITLDQRGWESSHLIRVRITGLAIPNEDLALLPLDPLRVGASRDGEVESNLLTTRQSFLMVAAEFLPDVSFTEQWWLLFDHERLSFSDVEIAQDALNDFNRGSIDLLDSSDPNRNFKYDTRLIPILDDYQEEVTVLNAPFGLLLLQVAALALFFLVVMAALVRRAERREVAMLQSRGAYNWQIVFLRGLEALTISVITVMVAPFIARELLIWIVPVLTPIEALSLDLKASAFIYAAGAGVASWLVLMATLRPILHLPLVLAGGSNVRSDSQLWWQKYHLDIVLVIIGIGALWRLIQTDSALTTTQLGEVQADPLLLLTPTLLLVALGSILLRLFPMISGLSAQILTRRTQFESALATWQVSREPTHYGRITFLLMLAIGIGWLATSFQATLSRSQQDRAAYAAGADVRFSEYDSELDAKHVRSSEFYESLEGVADTALTSRYFISNMSNDREQSIPGQVLGVNPMQDMAFWRDDLGEIAQPPALEHEAVGRALPFIPSKLGFWVRLDVARPDLTGTVNYIPQANPAAFAEFTIRLRDESGHYRLVDLSYGTSPEPLPEHWHYVEADLSEIPLHGQIRLENIRWRFWFGTFFINPRIYNRLSVSNLTLYDAEGNAIVLDWFLSDDSWELLYDAGSTLADVEAERVPAPDEPNRMIYQMRWRQVGGRSFLGLNLNYPRPEPVPAIISRRMMEVNNLLPGSTFNPGRIDGTDVIFEVVGTTDYYPTLYPDSQFFVLADLESLIYAINYRPGAASYPNEAWIKLDPNSSASAFLDDLSEQSPHQVLGKVVTLEETVNEIETDTLLAGLIGLLYLAFGVALTLSVISLFTYTALTVQRRKTEFGVLQALGLSSTRVVVSIALEQVIVMSIAVVLGVFLGAVMSSQVLPSLAAGTTGGAATPPFLIQIEMTQLVQYAAAMVGVLVITFGGNLWLVRRLSLSETLRFGEE